MEDNKIKNFYKKYRDKIYEKRFKSPYPLRRYVYREIHNSILKYIKKDQKVLEVGCGEGILAIAGAKKGASITALDISLANLEFAKKLAKEEKVADKITFIEGDAENLPFPDNSFDIVIADNVLEHLPNFQKGLFEIKRVTKKYALVALPTCLNPCAWCLLGGDTYWKIGKKTFFAIYVGFLKVLFSFLTGKRNVKEWYGQNKDIPHLLYYPWVIKKELEKSGFKIISFEAATFCLPYFNFFLPLIKFLNKYKNKPILNYLGIGSIVLLEKLNT